MINVSGGITDQVTLNVCRITDRVEVCGWITPLLLTNFYALQSFIPRVPGSSVVIATSYGLDGPRIESRWGARYSAPLQTGPRALLASCTMGTGSFPGVKSSRAWRWPPHPILVLWSRKIRAIPLLPLCACTRVHFTFTFTVYTH